MKKLLHTIIACYIFSCISGYAEPIDETNTSHPFALYKFQQRSLTAGVLDSSGNNNHAIAHNEISATSIANRIACRAAVIRNNTTKRRAALDTDVSPTRIGRQGTIGFWFRANFGWGSRKAQLISADTVHNTGQTPKRAKLLRFSASLLRSGKVTFHIEDRDGNDQAIVTDKAFRFASSRWVYLAFTWDYDGLTKSSGTGKKIYNQIYVSPAGNDNFRFQTSRLANIPRDKIATGRLGRMPNFPSLFIGDNRQREAPTVLGSLNSLHGFIDEVVIFDKVLTAAEINRFKNDSVGCPSVHHYEILHDGNGLTCEAESVTVRACINQGCSRRYLGRVSFGLTATQGSWLTDTFGFSGGQDNYALNNSRTGVSGIVLNNLTPSPANPTICLINGVASSACGVNFSDQAFDVELLNADSSVNSSNSYIAERDFKLAVTARQKDENGAGCITADMGRVDLEVRQRCLHTGTCIENKFNTGSGAASATVSNSRYTKLNNVAFIAGQTTLDAVYNETGQIAVDVRYDLTPSDATDSEYIIGSSPSFDVIPDKLLITAKKQASDELLLNSEDATGALKHIAGDDFYFSVAALGEKGNVLQQYQPGNLQLRASLSSPSAGNAGVLDIYKVADGASIGAFDAMSVGGTFATLNISEQGEFKGLANFSEVGVIDVEVMDVSYLTKYEINSEVTTIGRFQPAAFDVDVNLNVASNPPYAYTGQALSLASDTVVTLTAVNRQGETTKNYDTPDYFKHSTSDTAAFDNRTYTSDISGITMFSSTAMGNFSLNQARELNGDGEVNYLMSKDDHDLIGFSKPQPHTAEELKFSVNFSRSDLLADGVGYLSDLSETEYSGYTQSISQSTPELRYGRVRLIDGFGQQNQMLNVDLRTEYCVEVSSERCTGWQLNTDDSVSTYNSDDLDVKVIQTVPVSSDAEISVAGSGTTLCGVPLPIVNSGCSISPRANNFIRVKLESERLRAVSEVSLNVPNWLEYPWTEECKIGETEALSGCDPKAQIVFGVYRGHDRIINWQELE